MSYSPYDVYQLSKEGNAKELLLALSCSSNTVDWYTNSTSDGYVAIHEAAINGCDDCIVILINHGVDIDIICKRGYTPLALAVKHDQHSTVQLLLEYGAYIESQTFQFQTPLHISVSFNNENITSLLLNHGADMECGTEKGFTPLNTAITRDAVGCVRELLDRGCDVESKISGGFNCCHIAVTLNHIRCLQLCCDRGADLEHKANGLSPLFVAASLGRTACVTELLNRGAHLSLFEYSGNNDNVKKSLRIIAKEAHRRRKIEYKGYFGLNTLLFINI